MAYNFKEKAKFLRELGHPSHAESDLLLLLKLAPQHDLAKTAKPFPKRYAEQILYALLDITTAEAIILNRREENNLKEETTVEPVVDQDETPGEETTVEPVVDQDETLVVDEQKKTTDKNSKKKTNTKT